MESTSSSAEKTSALFAAAGKATPYCQGGVSIKPIGLGQYLLKFDNGVTMTVDSLLSIFGVGWCLGYDRRKELEAL